MDSKYLVNNDFSDIKNMSTKEKSRLLYNMVTAIEEETELYQEELNRVKIVLRLFDLVDIMKNRAIEFDFNSITIYMIKGAIFELCHDYDYNYIPDIILDRSGLWIGDSDNCLLVNNNGVSLPPYYVPSKDGIKLSIEIVDYIQNYLKI